MIQDFKCTYGNSAGIREAVTNRTNLTFPDAYKHAETMAELAQVLKECDKAPFCELPFCHTVEAEAMGGIINYGNEDRTESERISVYGYRRNIRTSGN